MESGTGLDSVRDRQEQVLGFWFGDMAEPRAQWFVKDPAFDREIEARFGPLIEEALAGGCAHWVDGPRPALAFVIVLDQFTRNVFRGTLRAFAGDPAALAAARRIVAEGWDRELVPLQRWFCYLPFEHSEALADQQESLRLFGEMRDDPQAGGAFSWAQSHHDVIARFGRFPHRNEILGRESTAEETVFLRQPGSRF